MSKHRVLKLIVILPEGASSLDATVMQASITLGKSLHAAREEGGILGWEWGREEEITLTDQGQ